MKILHDLVAHLRRNGKDANGSILHDIGSEVMAEVSGVLVILQRILVKSKDLFATKPKTDLLDAVEQEVEFLHRYLDALSFSLHGVSQHVYLAGEHLLVPCINKATSSQFVLGENLVHENIVFYGDAFLLEQVIQSLSRVLARCLLGSEEQLVVEIVNSDPCIANYSFIYFGKRHAAKMQCESMLALEDAVMLLDSNILRLGMFFCREVMSFIGGKICCQATDKAIEGFVLQLPTRSSNQLV